MRPAWGGLVRCIGWTMDACRPVGPVLGRGRGKGRGVGREEVRASAGRRDYGSSAGQGLAWRGNQLQLFSLFERFQPQKRLQPSLIRLNFVRPVTPKVAGSSPVAPAIVFSSEISVRVPGACADHCGSVSIDSSRTVAHWRFFACPLITQALPTKPTSPLIGPPRTMLSRKSPGRPAALGVFAFVAFLLSTAFRAMGTLPK
jgi:hypothetical protein